MEEQDTTAALLKSPRLRSREDRSTPTAIDLEATGPRKRDRDSQFGPTTPGADDAGVTTSTEGLSTPSHAAKKGRIISRDGSLLDMAGGTGTSFVPRPEVEQDLDADATPPGTPRPSSIPQSPAVASRSDFGPASASKDTPPDTPVMNSTGSVILSSNRTKPETSRVKEMRERVQDMTTEEGESERSTVSAAPSPPAENLIEEISDLPASAAEADRNGELHHHDGDVVIDEASTPSASVSASEVPAFDLPPHDPVTKNAVSAIPNAPRFVPPPSPASSVRADTGSNIGETDYLDSLSATKTTSRMSSMSSLRGASGSSAGPSTPHLHLHSALPNSSSASGFDTPSDALSDISTEANPPETPRPLADVDTSILGSINNEGSKSSFASTPSELSAPPSPAAPVLNAPSSTSGSTSVVQANFGRPTSSYSPAPSSSAPPLTNSKPFVNPFSSFGSGTSSPFAASKSKLMANPSTSSNLSTAAPVLGFGGSSSASPFASTATSGKSAFDHVNSKDDQSKSETDDASVDAFGSNERRTESPAEVHMLTGEEDEFTQFQMPRAKLYVLEGGDWKERGVGQLRLNTKTNTHDDKMSARMVMRSEAVHRLILNISLFSEMNVTLAQEKFLRFSAFEEGKLQHFTVRCANSTLGKELYDTVLDLKETLPRTLASSSNESEAEV